MRFILNVAVLELEPSRRIFASKHISLDEDYFPVHFPGLLGSSWCAAGGNDRLRQPARGPLTGIDHSLWRVFLQIRHDNFRNSVLQTSDMLIQSSSLAIEVS